VPPTPPESSKPLPTLGRRLTGVSRGLLLASLLPAFYLLALLVLGGQVRPEHVLFAVAAPAFVLVGPRGAALFRGLLPLLITSIGYDCVRYARAAWVTADRVRSCSFKHAEVALFGVGPDLSVPEWFADHHVPVADALAGIPYFGFIYVAVGYAIWLAFRDRARMHWFAWSFALANWISFFVWILVPVAPPWYVHQHGCLVDMQALPSAAGLARVDALLGVPYFAHFYARAASVYGALPSMHCAYPLLGLFTAWKASGWKTRAVHLGYALWMAMSAVYLSHHWVIDVFAGWATAAAGVGLAKLVVRRQAETIALGQPRPASEARSAA